MCDNIKMWFRWHEWVSDLGVLRHVGNYGYIFIAIFSDFSFFNGVPPPSHRHDICGVYPGLCTNQSLCAGTFVIRYLRRQSDYSQICSMSMCPVNFGMKKYYLKETFSSSGFYFSECWQCRGTGLKTLNDKCYYTPKVSVNALVFQSSMINAATHRKSVSTHWSSNPQW